MLFITIMIITILYFALNSTTNPIPYLNQRGGADELTNRKITSFPTPLPLEYVTAPPKDSSNETSNEIKYLSKLTTDKDNAKRIQISKQYIKTDDVIKAFVTYASDSGLMFDEERMKTLGQDVETLCLNIQKIYNRTRPYRLAKRMKVAFKSDITANTPSYPATNTVLAHVLAKFVGYYNQTWMQKLQSLAERIELAQLYLGLHYPSDNEISHKIADTIATHIQY